MPETTLHVTHWKAGSTWIRRILRQLEPDRFAPEVGLAVPDDELERAVKDSRFRRQTGRRRGDEAADHLRKGVAGDWRNHFTDRVAAEFERRFG